MRRRGIQELNNWKLKDNKAPTGLTYAILDLEDFQQCMALANTIAKDFGSDISEELTRRWGDHNIAVDMSDSIDNYLLKRRIENKRNAVVYGGCFSDRKFFRPVETTPIHQTKQ